MEENCQYDHQRRSRTESLNKKKENVYNKIRNLTSCIQKNRISYIILWFCSGFIRTPTSFHWRWDEMLSHRFLCVCVCLGMGKGQHRMPTKDELVQRYNRMNTMPQVRQWRHVYLQSVLVRGINVCVCASAESADTVAFPPEQEFELHRSLWR